MFAQPRSTNDKFCRAAESSFSLSNNYSMFAQPRSTNDKFCRATESSFSL
jgi:hypothetical protein